MYQKVEIIITGADFELSRISQRALDVLSWYGDNNITEFPHVLGRFDKNFSIIVRDTLERAGFHFDINDVELTRKLDGHYAMYGHVFELKEDVMGQDWHGHGADLEFTDHPLPAGTKVKVVMASRFGDVGITDDLEAETGYIARVEPVVLRDIYLRNMLSDATVENPELLEYTAVVMSLRETEDMETLQANNRIKARLRVDSDKFRAYREMDKIMKFV